MDVLADVMLLLILVHISLKVNTFFSGIVTGIIVNVNIWIYVFVVNTPVTLLRINDKMHFASNGLKNILLDIIS